MVSGNPMLPEPYRIGRVRAETHDTFTIELVPSSANGTIPAFEPGQFNMIYAFGTGEVPISISGDPANGRSITHTIRSVGTVTKAIQGLKRGSVVGVRGPFGSCWPLDEAQGKDVVIVTGGIGLAPLRPAIYRLIADREKYGKIVLLYGARTPRDLLYVRELEKWRGRFDIQVGITTDTAKGKWRGNVGVVTTLIPRAAFDPAKCVAMICGPEIMMRFTIMELKKFGVPAERVYVSMERNMKCAVGFCGHCQFGSAFVCKDGPVFRYDKIQYLFGKREI